MSDIRDRAVLLSIECKMHAMLIANRIRERNGQAPAYSEESFLYLAEDAEMLAKEHEYGKEAMK